MTTTTTTVNLALREEDTDISEVADRLAQHIKEAAARVEQTGHRVNPASIKVMPDQVNATLNHLVITMRATR